MLNKIKSKKAIICIVGIGYVGLPTALLFAEKGFKVIGADINKEAVDSLNSMRIHLKDLNLEDKLKKVMKKGNFKATTKIAEAVKESDAVLITVPTPVKENKQPDLSAVISASKDIAKGLDKNKIVVLESTTYPLTTEEVVKPILEKTGLKCGKDFYLAFSPERYNPGDSEHEIQNIVKIVGGVDKKSGEIAEALYSMVINKVKKVSSAKVAEASKVVENIKRNVNIGLVNELSLIFEKMGIDIYEVLEAASTKWNFNKFNFKPGPGVGGHCIPVDPYYLYFKSEKMGYKPKFINLANEINDYMPHHTVELIKKSLKESGRVVKKSSVAVLGIAYKPNIGDTRNSPALMIIKKLKSIGTSIVVHDPYVERKFLDGLGVDVKPSLDEALKADCVVIVSDHDAYHKIKLGELKKKMNKNPVLIDTRNVFNPEECRELGFVYRGIGRF